MADETQPKITRNDVPLWGANAIAAEIGLDRGQTYHLLNRGLLPARQNRKALGQHPESTSPCSWCRERVTMTRRQAVKRLIAAVPFWHDPDEPLAEMVGPINAEVILKTLEGAGVVMFQTARRARVERRSVLGE